MNTKVHALAMISGFLLPSLVLADFGQARLVQLQADMPNATPYQILERLFDGANDKIELSDIDRLGKTCAGAALNSVQPYQSGPVHHFKASRVVAPGTPPRQSMGPLFPSKPGTPDQVLAKEGPIVMSNGQKTDDSANEWARLHFDHYSVRFQPDEISTIYPGPAIQYQTPFKFSVRKTGDLLSYQFDLNFGSPDHRVTYGYCWLEQPAQ